MILIPLSFSVLLVRGAFVSVASVMRMLGQGFVLGLYFAALVYRALGPARFCVLCGLLFASVLIYQNVWGSRSPAATTTVVTPQRVSFADLAQQADSGALCPECGLRGKIISTTAVVQETDTNYLDSSDHIVSLVPGGAYRGHSNLVCAEAISKVVIQKGQRVHVTGTISDADSPPDQGAGTTFHMDSCTVAPA